MHKGTGQVRQKYKSTLYCLSILFNFYHREICIEFNHSQLDYYTELDAVSMGGILKLPESGELDFMTVPMVTHTTSGYVYDNNEEQNQNLVSDIRMPSNANVMASNVNVMAPNVNGF